MLPSTKLCTSWWFLIFYVFLPRLFLFFWRIGGETRNLATRRIYTILTNRTVPIFMVEVRSAWSVQLGRLTNLLLSDQAWFHRNKFWPWKVFLKYLKWRGCFTHLLFNSSCYTKFFLLDHFFQLMRFYWVKDVWFLFNRIGTDFSDADLFFCQNQGHWISEPFNFF